MHSKKIIFALIGAVIIVMVSGVVFTGTQNIFKLSQLGQLLQIQNTTGLISDGVTGTPPAPSSNEYCSGYNDDRDYLYNLDTLVFTKNDGTESFIAKRRSDNKIVRQDFSDERFFLDRSGGTVATTYDIVEKCGGVDIVYTVRNTTGQNQNAPDFRVDGIKQHTSGDFYILDQPVSGYLRNVKKANGTVTNVFLGAAGGENYEYGPLTYPNFYYSPVLVTNDTDFVAGSGFLYPYLQYKHDIVPQITKVTSGQQTSTWRHEYRQVPTDSYQSLGPNEQRSYTVSLRFTEPRSWIVTLEGYKKFFKQTYGNVDVVKPQDFRPIYGTGLAYGDVYNAITNPRSYTNVNGAPFSNWQDFVNLVLPELQTRGYKRTMFWTASGLYAQDSTCIVIGENNVPNSQNCNYPPAFMDFVSSLQNSVSSLGAFAQNGIDLGFWWGRGSYVPNVDAWNPSSVHIFNPNNSSDTSFMNRQLDLAYDRGAKIIGLDAFGGPLWDRYTRIDQMKQRTSNKIIFAHEGAGPDIMHRKMANFVTSAGMTWWTQYDKTRLVGPDVLSRYLNNGSESWAFMERPPYCGVTEMEKMAHWGFTPLYMGICAGVYPVTLANLDLRINQCFDNIDNDGDGNVDWPFDYGCDSAEDNAEYSSNERIAPNQGTTPGPTPIPDIPGSPPSEGSSSRNRGSSGSTASRIETFQLLQRIQELQAIILQLQAQIALRNASLQGTSAPANPSQSSTPTAPTGLPSSFTFTRDLGIGSTGADVTMLQRFLVEKGFLVIPSGVAYGEFGQLTKTALARYQVAGGITPADGYFGALTRIRVNNLFTNR